MTHKQFCRIFETEEYGQILIVADTHEETGNPAILVSVVPPDLGVCTVCISFKDSDEGWDARDDALVNFTLGKAERMANGIFSAANPFSTQGGGE